MKHSRLFSYIPFFPFHSSLKEMYSFHQCGINNKSTTIIKKRFQQISFPPFQLKSYDLKEYYKNSLVFVYRTRATCSPLDTRFPLFPFQRIAYAAKCTCIRLRRRKNDKAKQVNTIINDNNESFIAITTTRD